MTQPRAATVTLLFTDLVNSTALLQRAGDEQAQRIFQGHHKLLKEAVAANGGHAVKWLGDGLMVAFPSAADAVRCAVAMQQASRRPVAGERLAIRVGLNAGEALREETDYFGMPVVVARRLCEHATGGQILCSTVLSGLLASRSAFSFRDCGLMELKGLAAPVATCEVVYEHDEPAALLTQTPFVERAVELERLQQKLQEVRAGHGGLVMLVGEPGIGKTRTAEEFAERASYAGVQVLWGRCYEGEWAPPYGPFAEAIATYGTTADAADLREDLGLGAAPIARLVPALRERLPDIPEPAALQPDEERFRLLDAVCQFFIAVATRAPVVLVLDDLHWADKATIALLRHVARFVPRHRILVLGTYRDVEVESTGALAEALRALPRETTYEHLKLEGLDTQEVEQLVTLIADQDVPDAFVSTIRAETSGNPFFIREVLLQLVSENKITRQQGSWVSSLSIEEMKIPEGVRQVISRRLSQLSAEANRLLSAAAGFNGLFRFDIAAAVAGLDEAHGLSAVDEALGAQMLRPGRTADMYDFTHALIRHTLYAELSPSRQVRLHRQIAETMERVYGDGVAEHAAQVAYQYHCSASLPGAGCGGAHALVAAVRAEAAYARDDSITFLRIALELLPQNDARRARLLGRLGMALAWTLNFDAALQAMRQAGDIIAAAEGEDAAADYLAEAAMGLWGAGCQRGGWALASQGLGYIRDRRDITWVRLMVNDILRREAEDSEQPGITIDTPERRSVVEIAERLSFPRAEKIFLGARGFFTPKSRQDIQNRFADDAFWLTNGAGEYRRSVPMWEDLVAGSQREGRIRDAVACSTNLARCHNALGATAAARTVYDRTAALARRLTGLSSDDRLTWRAARYEMQTLVDEGWENFLPKGGTLQQPAIENNWLFASSRAVLAKLYARLGRTEEAVLLLGPVTAPLDRAPGWAFGYTLMACEAATALWLLRCTDHIEVIERNLREKVLVPDFRSPMVDGRLSMAHLCSLQGRYGEAVEWFARARAVLDEQGARPLRAIVDFDESLMYHRRAGPGDSERMQSLLDVALQQFRALEMTGWIKRAEELLRDRQQPAEANGQEDRAREAAGRQPETVDQGPGTNLFRKEGDYWSITFEGCTFRLKDVKGLHYLAHLLRHPGQEFHVLQLVQDCAEPREQRLGFGGRGAERIQQSRTTSDQGPSLDAKAKAAYQRRFHDLRAELDEAERNNDLGGAAKARAEMEFIADQLAAAVGLGGRDRPVGTDAERARLTVTKGIKSALAKIRANQPELARHLAASIKTGYLCGFTPDPKRPGTWVP